MAAVWGLSQIVHFDSFKPRLEAAATDALGETVHIKGHINVGFIGWRPSIVLHNVEIGLDARADRVELTLLQASVTKGLMIHADAVVYAGHEAGDYDIPLYLVEKGFKIAPLKGKLDGASIKGEVTYIGDDFRADLKMEGLPLRRLLQEAEGKVDSRLKVAGKGLTGDDILRTLSGRFTLSSLRGTLTSKSLNFWARGLMQVLLPMQKDETKLNCAVADFAIKNGTATSRAVIVDTNEIAILGKGSIDLVKERVDMLLVPNPKDLALVSLATPVRLKGPFSNIVPTPETKGVAKKVGGLLLGVVNPSLLLLPLLEEKTTGDYKGVCIKILQENAKES